MPLLATDKGGSDIPLIAAGNYQAVCYGVIDVGTQPGGKYDPTRKVIIQFELPLERFDFKRNDKTVNLPRAISATYTLSLGTKANLRKTLEAWRAKPFTEEELKGFDLQKLVGANCMLQVIHKAGTGANANKTYANISAIASLPKGMERKKLENKPLFFSFDDLAPKTLPEFEEDALPEWIMEMIKDSEEYRKIQREIGQTPNQVAPAAGATPPAGQQATDDGAPF